MSLARYNKLNLKKPIESPDYAEWSKFIVSAVNNIIGDRISSGNNKITINTNLKLGLPMENINKVAGPFVEAWAFEVFSERLKSSKDKFHLVNVEAGERLNMADIVLQFKRTPKEAVITGNVDVKATSQDIPNSGKSPNITSFARIRSAYIDDADYVFIILSLKHKVYSTRDDKTGMMNGIMEVVDHNTYDLKFLSTGDISYNPALGTGQLQIRDIHYVQEEIRSAWEFCQMLDHKVINSKKGFDGWYAYAVQNEWIK